LPLDIFPSNCVPRTIDATDEARVQKGFTERLKIIDFSARDP
jgi:hypothetical protein